MKIRLLRADMQQYLVDHSLVSKFAKQSKLLEKDIKHPSLNVERLEPKQLKLYSFRLDRQYRVIFIFVNGAIEIVDINNHYR